MSAAGTAAAAAYLLALLIVLEAWSVHRRHSHTPWGWTGFRSRPGVPVSAATGAGFIAAALAGFIASLLSWAAVVPTLPTGGLTRIVVGATLAGAALVLGFAARADISRAWPSAGELPGVPRSTPAEAAAIRNPLFTAVMVFQLGVTVIAPNWLSVLALIAVIAVCHLQVRAVEEPYLIRIYGAAYLSYARHSGRFVPRPGRRFDAATRPPKN